MMFRKFRINSIFIALPMVFAVATDVLAARPTNPADWPAVKDVYTDYFLIGNTSLSAANFGANVVPGENSDAAMTLKHFNIVTPDNAMKPDSLWSAGITGPTPSFLTNLTSGINNDITAANARGFKVNGHTISWHNQSAQWPAANVTTSAGLWETPWDYVTAKANFAYYVQTVGGHFNLQPFNTYSFDVVNEAMRDNPDNPADWRNALRTGYNPEERPSRWAQAYSKGGNRWDYLYDAFFNMRQNTTSLLNYNDFNDNERDAKTIAIASMIKEFNERYAADSAAGKGRILLDADGNPRPLVDTIGTQGHFDMRLNLDTFERAVKTYLDLGVNVDVTELDVMPNIGLDKGQRIPNGTEMNGIFLDQGVFYAKLFKILREYAAGPGGGHPEYKGGIHRVTWWGYTDPGYHINGYPWSGIGQPKEAYWAVVGPDQYLLDAGLPANGVTATFNYGGEAFTARTWGGKYAYATLDINVPPATKNVNFTAQNVSLPAGFGIDSIKYDPADCAVIPGKPCHVTVVARGPDPAAAYNNVGVENTATYVLTFGQMAVSWFEDTSALEAPLSYAEVRFSDGVTNFKQYKTYYGSDGTLQATGETESAPVPKHGRSTLILNSGEPTSAQVGLRLNKDSTTQKAWRLAKRIEAGRTYMVVSAESVFQANGETMAYALTNRTKPATTATSNPPAVPESLSRSPVILRGDTLLPLANTNAPESEPDLAQDNLKFMFEENLRSPAAGPYASQEGYTMDGYIHGTNVYPMIVFRGNGATGTVVNGQNSLITRQTNGSEGPQIADRALDQAVWFHTPIDQQTGEMKMFLYTGRGATNQHYVLKEVVNGNTPKLDTGNAISQRQASTGGFIALQAASPDAGTSVKLYAYDMAPYVPGDVNGDNVADCADVAMANSAVGTRTGQAGFLPSADLDNNGVIDFIDVKLVRVAVARTPGYGIYSCP